MLYEVGPGSASTAYVWIGGELLGIARGSQLHAAHNDQLGRPEVLTSASGAIVWRAKNDAFDRTVLSTSIGAMNLGFPGQYFDSESGLWHNWHRVYDASIGRYTQADPIGLIGGINAFEYVGGNPLAATDTEGLLQQRVAGAIIGGVGSAFGEYARQVGQGGTRYSGADWASIGLAFVGGAGAGAYSPIRGVENFIAGISAVTATTGIVGLIGGRLIASSDEGYASSLPREGAATCKGN